MSVGGYRLGAGNSKTRLHFRFGETICREKNASENAWSARLAMRPKKRTRQRNLRRPVRRDVS